MLLIDTCVLPRSRMENVQIYQNRFGENLGCELLPMFDLPDFEEDLRKNLDRFAEFPLLTFHEPVWFVEHSAPRGSKLYEASMVHILLTKKYAEILHPRQMVYHINNIFVNPERKDEMLRTSLENLDEMRNLFPDVQMLVENVGTDIEGNKLLDQQEFTDLCKDQHFDVLIDVGHANANGWDLYKLIGDLKDQIRGFHLHNNDGIHDLHDRIFNGTIDFNRLIPFIRETTPEADWVIEYTRPEYHGKPLMEDIASLLKLA